MGYPDGIPRPLTYTTHTKENPMSAFTVQRFTARWAQEVLAQEGVALTAPFIDLVDTIVEGIEEAMLDNAPECFHPNLDTIYEVAADLAMEVAE
jgi:hypothetical protein